MWSKRSTLLPLDLCVQHLSNTQSVTVMAVWKEIANAMIDQGYSFTPDECEKEWHSLHAIYTQIDDYNSNICRKGRLNWEYYTKVKTVITAAEKRGPLRMKVVPVQ